MSRGAACNSAPGRAIPFLKRPRPSRSIGHGSGNCPASRDIPFAPPNRPSRLPRMADPYGDLLTITIDYLNDLRTRGVRHVSVSAETWAALKSVAPRTAGAAPARSVATPSPTPTTPRTSHFVMPPRGEPTAAAAP